MELQPPQHRTSPPISPVLPCRLCSVTLATQTHEVSDLSPQWIIDPIEWNDVVHVLARRIVTDLADGILLSDHSTDLHPLPVIATFNAITFKLFTLLLTFC